MISVRAFAGALGRHAGSPPQLTLAGQPLSVRGGDGSWVVYATATRAAEPALPVCPGDAPEPVASGRPFFDGNPSVPLSDRELARADGKFSLAWLSGDACLLATDCLGAGSLFFRVIDDTIYFADQLGLLLQIVRGPIQPNKLAIAALCIGQLQLTPETHVRGIFRLGAGECLRATRRGPDLLLSVATTTYVALPDALTSAPAIRDPQSLDEALWRGIEREQYGPRTALMLSGGRDSRALALAGRGQGFEAVTYGSRLSFDVMWAKRFAHRASLKHHVVPYDTWSFQSYADVIIDLGGGTQGLQIANNLVGYDWARERFDLAVVGYMGDPTMGSHLGLQQETPDQLFYDLLMGREKPRDCDLRAIFAPEIEDMRSIVKARIHELKGLPRHQIHRILDFTIRQSTWISGMFSTCAWYLPLSYPFFHRPLLAGMFQADFDLLAGQRLYDRWLAWKQERLGIQYAKSPWPERLLSLRTRLSKGMWPPTRVFWPDVHKRSRQWLDARADCGIEYLDRITRESMGAMKPDSNADDPVFCMSIPLQDVFTRWGRA